MSQDNSAQKTYWNDTAGPSWVMAQASLDAMLEPLSVQAIDKASAQAGEQVLDVGCGCGATTLALADSGALVTGVDLSEPMIARAQERAAGSNNVDFVVKDACDYDTKHQFDLIFSRFGVMFFANPYEAFKHLHAQLKPSGRLVFICWQTPDQNPWMALPGRAVAPFLPLIDPPPQPTDPGPFALANQDYTRDILSQAGFKDIGLNTIEAGMFLGADLDEVMSYQRFVGPVARVVKELQGTAQQQALAAARAVFEPHITESGLSLPGRAWLVTARA
ncbi:MAG: class I SAM-dependent methyltransferase [Halieaceae bacterium]|nr:class I SAM-dependent methyltransferase [Halieaceae bacterium]